MRRGAGALLVLSALCAVRTVHAEDPDALVRAQLEARGGTAPALLGREFVFEGQALVRRLSFAQAGCRALFAWGGTRLRDVDLTVYSEDGLALAEDRSSAAYGYTRVCAAAGVSLYAVAQAYAGRGELSLYTADSAPRAFGRPPEALRLGLAQGGRASAARSVGGEAAELTVEAPLLHDERQLASSGYVAMGPPSVVEVRAGLAEAALLLPGGRCFRIDAFVPGARGVALDAEFAGRQRQARNADGELVPLAVCLAEPGAVNVRVRTRALRSLAVMRVFEHPDARLGDAAQYGEDRALLLAEARIVARSRGFPLDHLGEAWSERGNSVSWPLSAAPGQCLMIAALPSAGIEPELLLTDEHGSLLARNEGRRGLSTLFACLPQRTTLRVQLRAHGSDGAVSLWWGVNGAS